MMMHLQRQRSAGLDFDAFDLEALAFFQHGISTPRTIYFLMQLVAVVLLFLELTDDFLHILDP